MKKPDVTYCAFIDVLGYGNIMLETKISTIEKCNILNSIYNSLLCFPIAMFPINQKTKIIHIKSFSDSIYLESDNIEILLYSCYQFFNIVFNRYQNFTFQEKYTPLLRCGIVKDWTMKFYDIDDFCKTKSLNNIVGLGVVRAYQVSEKSSLSGMRIIISPEVIAELKLVEKDNVSFECLEYFSHFHIDLTGDNANKKFPLYFSPIRKNEKNEDINLYELIWPVYYPIPDDIQQNIFSCIDELVKMEQNFNDNNRRHFIKTAEVISKALILSDKKGFNKKDITHYEELINNKCK